MNQDFINYLNVIPGMSVYFAAGMLIFLRFIGFMSLAPVFGRKDIPTILKLSFALLMTIAFVGILEPAKPPANSSYFVLMVLNFVFGSLIGFIAQCVFAAISAAGDMMNTQMGLSSSMMFDPNLKTQSTIMGAFFSLMGTLIFINIGGLYWLFAAFQRSFEVFPLFSTSLPLAKIISMKYLILLTGNVLFIGLQFAAPILIATLGQDIILGIISKTAPQINVFQLSFLFKPVMGVAILMIIMPILINIINDYFIYFSKIY